MEIIYTVTAIVITLPIVSTKFYSKENNPGALLCLAMAVPAWLLGKQVPVAGGAVFGILLGMMLANFWHYPPKFGPGIKNTSKRVLQAAIVLLGFQMNLGHVLGLSGRAFLLVITSIITAFLTAYIVGRLIGLGDNEKTLIGIGTAICGGSAVAAAAPVIDASEKEVARAISTIFLFNLIAVFIFPTVGHLMQMSDLRFGMWAGSAINDTSSVVAAGYSFSNAAGNTATVVKLTRTLMLIPVTFHPGAVPVQKRTQCRRGFCAWQVLPMVCDCLFAGLHLKHRRHHTREDGGFLGHPWKVLYRDCNGGNRP
jgi:uncharacterized integral membrane protein (TIGR00698 family)